MIAACVYIGPSQTLLGTFIRDILHVLLAKKWPSAKGHLWPFQGPTRS